MKTANEVNKMAKSETKKVLEMANALWYKKGEALKGELYKEGPFKCSYEFLFEKQAALFMVNFFSARSNRNNKYRTCFEIFKEAYIEFPDAKIFPFVEEVSCRLFEIKHPEDKEGVYSRRFHKIFLNIAPAAFKYWMLMKYLERCYNEGSTPIDYLIESTGECQKELLDWLKWAFIRDESPEYQAFLDKNYCEEGDDISECYSHLYLYSFIGKNPKHGDNKKFLKGDDEVPQKPRTGKEMVRQNRLVQKAFKGMNPEKISGASPFVALVVAAQAFYCRNNFFNSTRADDWACSTELYNFGPAMSFMLAKWLNKVEAEVLGQTSVPVYFTGARFIKESLQVMRELSGEKNWERFASKFFNGKAEIHNSEVCGARFKSTKNRKDYTEKYGAVSGLLKAFDFGIVSYSQNIRQSKRRQQGTSTNDCHLPMGAFFCELLQQYERETGVKAAEIEELVCQEIGAFDMSHLVLDVMKAAQDNK